jgi:hypothetical protein
LRFAYADPPYPGQSARWYKDHPDYAGEVDHVALVARLEAEYPDGWALSTSANAMRDVLTLCPPTAQVAIWHVTNRNLRGNGRWELAWEPVIVNGGRQKFGEAPIVRNVLTCSSVIGILGNSITGQKPPAFTRWVHALLGAEPGDTVHDLFPGSGAVGAESAALKSQPVLPFRQRQPRRYLPAREARRAERLGGQGVLELGTAMAESTANCEDLEC